jgi:acylphosphatase
MASGEPAVIRRTMYFSGLVQGVGFRWTVEHLSRKFRVTGYVRNLRDGRVEVVAEGEADELHRFRRAIEDAMQGHIDRVQTEDSAATGEFPAFRIAF